eukprot:TRINITY_DN1303_c1_g2_i1.p1 TRINITY_DN1303_c1_g2~~TRINITY_DN1303_c1_g2_i1.p1  ORF type:complete len:305 (+),score=44.57 TRINITY_DN1303_c1_g2_i1:76-990(+)
MPNVPKGTPRSAVEVEILEVTTKGKELKSNGKVVLSMCKVDGDKVTPVKNCTRKTRPGDGGLFELPLFTGNDHFLVCNVSEAGRKVGLVSLPMSYFLTLTKDPVDRYLPLKLDQTQTGEVLLRLGLRGELLVQAGSAYKVTGVRMDTRKLLVEVIEGEVPRRVSSYVELALPNHPKVLRTTQVARDTSKPAWNERFQFFSEVKNTPYLLVHLRHEQRNRKPFGTARIPLLFFLSLHDSPTIEDWFPIKDVEGAVAGRIKLKMSVVQRASSEISAMFAPLYSVPVEEEEEEEEEEDVSSQGLKEK